jgi:uncharacterized protein YjbI with pentapeptide repeats
MFGVRRRRSIIAGWFPRRLGLFLAALGVTGILFLVVAVFPPLLAGGEDSENEVRGTLLQALAGLVLLVGLYLTYRTFDLNRQGQVTERFTRAIDQLGEESKLDVRLGGIYALERIAWDSERDHWPTMEVLTAYVREHAPLPPPRSVSEPEAQKAGSGPSTLDEAPSRKAIPADIQAILSVLSRRNTEYDKPESRLDLGRANLQGADLRGANLRRADLRGANLRGADLIEANLQGANLSGANLQARLRGANLEGAHLIGPNLQGADLIGANLRGADLTGANLRRAYLIGVNLQGANLDGATLREADLRRAALEGASLRRAELLGVSLDGATFQGAKIDPRTMADVDLVSLGARPLSE